MKSQQEDCRHNPISVDQWFHREKRIERSAYWGRKKLREIVLLERMLHGPREYLFDWKVDRRPHCSETTEARRVFDKLAEQWRNETAHLSSIPRIVMHPAYQQIMAMGRPALPYILRAMRDKPGYWFWALEMISRHNPVPPESAGHTRTMKKLWLDWGEDQGLV